VFGSPVPRLEKDRNWTGLGLIGLEIHRTAKDRNCSPVCGPLQFWKFQDRTKTSLDWSGLVFATSKGKSIVIIKMIFN
jgi:hypothetical protein